MPPKESTRSLIGEESVFQGKFYVKGRIEILGKFEGELEAQDEVIIGPTGKVKTPVVVSETVIVEGTLIGNIKASQRVVLAETGRILGDIEAPILDMKNGVVIQGKINITGNNKKKIEDLVKESYGSEKMSLDTKAPNATEATASI